MNLEGFIKENDGLSGADAIFRKFYRGKDSRIFLKIVKPSDPTSVSDFPCHVGHYDQFPEAWKAFKAIDPVLMARSGAEPNREDLPEIAIGFASAYAPQVLRRYYDFRGTIRLRTWIFPDHVNFIEDRLSKPDDNFPEPWNHYASQANVWSDFKVPLCAPRAGKPTPIGSETAESLVPTRQTPPRSAVIAAELAKAQERQLIASGKLSTGNPGPVLEDTRNYEVTHRTSGL